MQGVSCRGVAVRPEPCSHVAECREGGKVCKKHRPLCQVNGCAADLAAEGKHYCWHRHICSKHIKAEMILCPSSSQPLRFCLQCGKLEPLSAFDGHSRSCRTKLRKRRERLHKAKPAAKSKRVTCSDDTSSPADTTDTTAAGSFVTSDQHPQQEEQLQVDMNWWEASACSSPGAAMAAAENDSTLLAELLLQQQQQPEQWLFAEAEAEVCFAAELASSGPIGAAAAPPAAAGAAQAVPLLPPDEFELLLFRMLDEQLAAPAVQEFACSSNCRHTSSSRSRSRSSSPLQSHLAAAVCNSAGYACSSAPAHGGPQLPGLTPELHLPSLASLVGGCCSDNSSSMLAAASSLARGPSLVAPEQMAGPYPPCLGGYNAALAAPAAAGTAAVLGSTIHLGFTPAAGGAQSNMTQLTNDAELAAMQERLASLEAQVSLVIQAAKGQMGPQLLGA